MKSRVHVMLLTAALLLAQSARSASVLTEVPRADGARTPLRVYEPARRTGACAPLAIISHGAGGSENGYVYLAERMSDLGFTTVVMGHRESGGPALREAVRAQRGVRQGVEALVADTMAEQSRLLDVGAALNWSDSRCQAPFRVLMGHSMGAETVMLEAGATDMIGVDPKLRSRDRFDAYVALSPEGPGLVFPDHAWAHLTKPVLSVTGTRDASLTGPPSTRQIPWREMPGNSAHCQWLVVIEDATHMNLGGAGVGHVPVQSDVQSSVAAFLDGVRADACTAPPANSRTTVTTK